MPGRILERALTTISRHGMLRPGSRVIAAVSGGPDSVCLLHTLRELAPTIGFELTAVAHFNHQLRGEASDGDERFVADLARAMSLPFHATTGTPPEQGNLEQSARRMRRDFFAGLLQALPADCIALGHTRDDQAETVLFRLLRGSGLAGLAGILPVSAGIIRPLLDVTRVEVETFLQAREIPWREDASNRDPRFARNRIRHQLLPQLKREWNPRATDVLAHLADLAYEEERWWAAEIARRAEGIVVCSGEAIDLHAGELAALPRAIGRRLARHTIRLAKGDLRGIEFIHIERVLDLACGLRGGGRTVLPGVTARRSFDWIRLSASELQPPCAAPIQVQPPGEYPSPDGKSLIVLEFVEQVRGANAYATLGEELNVRTLPKALELRGWRPGDQYRPQGYSREHKIKDLFQQARIPSWQRASWPILSSDSAILWARSFGAAAEFAGQTAGSGAGRLRRLRIREIPVPR